MERWYMVKKSCEGLGFKQPSPVRMSIRRMKINYITMIKESVMSNERPTVFDRHTVPTSNVFVFDHLAESTQETSQLDFFELMQRKYK